MNSVLVGMFDTSEAATAARSRLLAAGFPASALSLTGGSTDATTQATEPQHEGGIARFFENLFGSDEADHERAGHTSTYTEAFKRGSFGLSVTTMSEQQMDQAEEILNAEGAIDIDERSDQWRKEGWTDGATAAVGTAVATGATTKLQEVQEELKVGKRAVARGGVRVFSRMTEVPVEESVVLREERADIKRTAVDRVASPADLEAFKEGSIEVREMSEEAVVSKTARVTGEVEVGTTTTEREERIRDTVRQTKVEVEEVAAAATGSTAVQPKL